MIIYLIKSCLCMLVMLTAFRFLFEGERMHRFNRAYLLGSLIFSLLVPFIPVANPYQGAALPNAVADVPNSLEKMIGTVIAPPQHITVETASPMSMSTVLLILYSIVAAGFLFRFVRNFCGIYKRASRHQQIPLEGARLILIPEPIVSHTFNRTIFISESDYINKNIEHEIIIHELAHVQQRHSLDIIFIELLHAAFWFNPLLVLYKRAIQLNHEFLADEAVLHACNDPKKYQHILLDKIMPAGHSSLSSAFNFNITKKRLIMLTQTQNKTRIILKKWMVAPLVICTLFFFSKDLIAQKQNDGKSYEVTIPGTQNLGPHPFVQIDGKAYPPEILSMISPACIRGTSTYPADVAIAKWGSRASDGGIIITTKGGTISMITLTEKERLIKEHAALTGFYHRLTLENEDGTSFDKFFINFQDGQRRIGASHEKGCKVGFVVGNQLFGEDEIKEVERLVNSLTIGKMGVNGGGTMKYPGLDLSSYKVIFYFNVLPSN